MTQHTTKVEAELMPENTPAPNATLINPLTESLEPPSPIHPDELPEDKYINPIDYNHETFIDPATEVPEVASDKTHDDSLYGSMNPGWRRVYDDIERFEPELLQLPTDEIERLYLAEHPKEKEMPVLIKQLKVAFWTEYNRSKMKNRKVTMMAVCRGVVNDTYINVLVRRQEFKKLAYIITPPQSYAIMAQETLEAGIKNLRNIATASVFFEDGSLNPRAAEAVIKAVAILDIRVKGAIVQKVEQKVEQKSVNVNHNVNNTNVQITHQLPQDMKELDAHIAKAKEKLIALGMRPADTISDTYAKIREDVSIESNQPNQKSMEAKRKFVEAKAKEKYGPDYVLKK